MIFSELALAGAFLIQPVRQEDDRGWFARTWCANEFEQRGLATRFVQCNSSFNRRQGTLRGMHFQAAPHDEAKLVRCTRGAIYDVCVDLRADSPTYLRWTAVELSARNGLQIYIPKGCAHGFQTLEDDTELFYQMSDFHEPASARGFRWNDPAFAIEWPITAPILSTRDQSYAEFRPHSMLLT